MIILLLLQGETVLAGGVRGTCVDDERNVVAIGRFVDDDVAGEPGFPRLHRHVDRVLIPRRRHGKVYRRTLQLLSRKSGRNFLFKMHRARLEAAAKHVIRIELDFRVELERIELDRGRRRFVMDERAVDGDHWTLVAAANHVLQILAVLAILGALVVVETPDASTRLGPRFEIVG